MTYQDDARATPEVAKVEMDSHSAALFRIRCDMALSQSGFAKRFALPFGTVKNIEQGRFKVTPAMALVLAAIEMDPALMARAARAVEKQSSSIIGERK